LRASISDKYWVIKRDPKAGAARRERFLQGTAGFWSTDRSLTVLLVLLIGNIFVVPLARFATWGRLTGRGILSLIIISGIVTTIKDRRLIALGVILAISSLFMGLEDVEHPNFYLHVINDLYSLLFIGFLAILILRQAFRPGPITSRRIQGSVAVYLLLGLLWAVAYEIVEVLSPGSFSIGARQGATLSQLGYFSFTTLTTLGFGDILPISPTARSLVVLEGLVGQLFPPILIARLVALEIEYHRSPRD
jgi:Ion channel